MDAQGISNIGSSADRILAAGHVEAGSALQGVWRGNLCPLNQVPKIDFSELLEHGYYLSLIERSQKQPLNLLDAASGNGAVTLAMALGIAEDANYPLEFNLVDMQQDAMIGAQSLLEGATIPVNLQINYNVNRIVNFPFQPDSLDGITFISGLHFIEPNEALASLRKMSKALKKDGILLGSVCTIFNCASLGKTKEGIVEKRLAEVLEATEDGTSMMPYLSMHSRYGPMYFYNQYSLQSILTESGLKLESLLHLRNTDYPNGLDDRYLENMDFIATRI